MKTHSDELTLFVAVVEAGSFRQAAENLGMDNSVVSRGIKRLEEKPLATVLLNRTTRRVSLTEGGSWFYQRAVKILTEMSEAEGLLLMRREQPEGILRVDAATPPSSCIDWCPSSASFAAATPPSSCNCTAPRASST